MTEGWRHSWIDLLSSLRGVSAREIEGTPTGSEAVISTPSSTQDASHDPKSHDAHVSDDEPPFHSSKIAGDEHAQVSDEVTEANSIAVNSAIEQEEHVARSPKQPDVSRTGYTFAAVIALLVTVPWILSVLPVREFLFEPKPPAPDVVATFDGGRVTLADVEAHRKLFSPSGQLEFTHSLEFLRRNVEDLISDRLVLHWAAERKPEAEETFRHAVKHINENLSLDALGAQLTDRAIPILESEILDYYESNKLRFGERTFAQAREEIRSILTAQKEPEFIDSYIAQLRENASITRDLGLLDIPKPSDDEIERYYKENLKEFAVPRRFVIDEIEFPRIKFGNDTQQRANDVLLSIRGGRSFRDAANSLPDARVFTGLTLAEGTRHPDWDKNVLAQAPGALSHVFQAGDSFYVVRLNEISEARVKSLTEVRSEIEQIVARRKEQGWYEANSHKTFFTLNGQRYTLGEFYAEYQELPPKLRTKYAGPEGLKKLAEFLIDRMLLVADTYDKLLDMKTKPFADEKRLGLLRQMMEQEEIDDKIEVTDAEMRDFHAQNADRLATPPKSRIRYVRIGLGTSDDEAIRARNRTEEAYNKLVPGFFGEAADFAAVAQEYSEDPESAAQGGEFPNWIGEDSDLLLEIANHPFHEAVMRLDVGDISKPFRLARSLYIVQVIERTEPQPLSFEDAKPFIQELLTDRKHDALTAEFQTRLLKEANVVMYSQVLREYLDSHSQPGGGETTK